jgi:hypothetical protein
MIAAQPKLGQIRKRVIARDQIGRQMAVIVVDRLVFRVAMIQLARLLGTEKEVVVNQRFCHEGRVVSSG